MKFIEPLGGKAFYFLLYIVILSLEACAYLQ